MKNKPQLILTAGLLLIAAAIIVHILTKNYTGPLDKDLVQFFSGLTFGFGSAMIVKGFYDWRSRSTANNSY